MTINDYILSTHPNPKRLGQRRRTQLNTLSNNSNTVNKDINKGNYPNIKPNKLIKKKEVSLNKLYPNLKTNKSLELNDDIVKLGSDRKYNDIVKYSYNRKEKHFVPKSTDKQTLLSFREFKEKLNIT